MTKDSFTVSILKLKSTFEICFLLFISDELNTFSRTGKAHAAVTDDFCNFCWQFEFILLCAKKAHVERQKILQAANQHIQSMTFNERENIFL